LLAQEKSTQRERHPHPSSAGADSLRSSPNRASRATRSLCGIVDHTQTCLEQGTLLLPGLTAVLGEGNGIGAPSLKPIGTAEHHSRFGVKRAALSELDLLAARRGKSCEFSERPNRREAQGKAVKQPCKLKVFDNQAFGAAFLLATFLWRSKEK
jgi:hypothetical protein